VIIVVYHGALLGHLAGTLALSISLAFEITIYSKASNLTPYSFNGA